MRTVMTLNPPEENLAHWRSLYTLTGYLAFGMIAIIVTQIAAFIATPFPESIEGWFALLQVRPLAGLVHLDLLYILNNSIVAVMYLAFYAALKEKKQGLLVAALVLGFIGIAAYMSSNRAFEMLSLSHLYQNANSDNLRTVYLAAGQSMLSAWQGTAFDVYYVLNAITLFAIAAFMLKSQVFTHRTAIVGLIAAILMAIPSTVGTVGLVFSLLSLIPWVVFCVLTGLRFLQIGRA